jgi:hypothetical protein
MSRIIEGVWDCTYCDSKKIRGSIYECPVCGRPRDKDIKFYIDNPHNYVDEEKAAKLNKNPDWVCSYCDGLNSDDNDTCYNCGASREESELNYLELQKKKLEEKKRDLMNEKATQEEKAITDEINYVKPCEDKIDLDEVIKKLENERTKLKAESKEKTNNIKSFFKKIGILLLIISVIVGGILLFAPKNEDVTVNNFEWTRTVEIQAYRTVEESDWSVPSGGRVKNTRQEIKSYIDVLDHYETKTRTYTEEVFDHYDTEVVGYEDMGNGYFKEQTIQVPVYRTEIRTETYQEPVYRQEPVYATKYYYEIDKWVYSETLKASQYDHSPYWPSKELSEKEREGTKREEYKIQVINEKGELKTYKLSFNEWNSLKVNQEVTLKTYVNGSAEIVIDK